MTMKRVTALVLGLGSLACTQRAIPPPFTVTDVEPAAAVLTPGQAFTLRFSQEVDPLSFNADSVVLAPTERVNTSFISDINNPPLSESRRMTVIPLQINLTLDNATIRPLNDLDAGTSYTLVLSKKVKSKAGSALVDRSGRENHFQVDWRTQGPQPRVTGTSLPSGNPPLVPPNLRSFTATFDNAVEVTAAGGVRVLGINGSVDVAVARVEALLDGVTVQVTLQDGTCTPLCAQQDYELHVDTGLKGKDGQNIQPFVLQFRTLDMPDTVGPALVRLPSVQPSEDQVSVRFTVREPARGRLRVGEPGGPYTEQHVVFSDGPCTGFQAARECPYVVTVTGLDLGGSGSGRTYGGLLEVTDDFGNTSVYGEFELRTVLLPRLRITEVYPNPPGDEKTQEFVEILNTSDVTSYDLAGMYLAAQDPATGNVTASLPLVGYNGGTTLLPPGRRAVVGSRAFDPGLTGVAADATVLIDGETSRSTLLGGLSSGRDSRKVVALFAGAPNEDAARITFYRAPPDIYAPGNTFPEGATAERLDETGDDDEATWCQSPAGPTPGRPNGVAGLAACP